MSRETKVGLVVALSFLLLVGGVLGYKLYFTGDPLLSMPDGANGAMAQDDGKEPEEKKPPEAGDGKPTEVAPDSPDQEKPKKQKKTPEEKALAKANAAGGKPSEAPPPTEEPNKPAAENKPKEEQAKSAVEERPTVLGRPGDGRPMTPPTEESSKPMEKVVTGGPSLAPAERPGTQVAMGPSGPPPAEEMPKLGPPPAEKPMTQTPMGPPPTEETSKLGGPMSRDETAKPESNERPSAGPPPTEETTRPSERPMVGGPSMPPPAEEPRPMLDKPGATPPPTEEPAKPQAFNEKPGLSPPPLPPAEEIRRTGTPPAEQPVPNLPPSPAPPAFNVKPSGPSEAPRELAPRFTGPAGSSPMPDAPKDVPHPPPSNTFERKYDAPALGKPEVARGPTSGTLVAGQQDNRPGIPLTMRPQPGKQPRDEAGGVPVVIQPPTWNTKDGLAPAKVESFELEVYVLKPGDTYATVSQMRYRSDRYQSALAQFNRERDGRLSSPQPGMSVYLPPAGYLERRYGVGNPAPGRGAAPESSQSWNASIKDKNVQPAGGRADAPMENRPVVQADGALPPNAKRYRVRPNDTIWNIAKATLGSGERWPDILKLNRDVLRDVNQLQAGMVLRLPDDARVDAPETSQ